MTVLTCCCPENCDKFSKRLNYNSTSHLTLIDVFDSLLVICFTLHSELLLHLFFDVRRRDLLRCVHAACALILNIELSRKGQFPGRRSGCWDDVDAILSVKKC